MTAQKLHEILGGDPLNDIEVRVLLWAARGDTTPQTAERLNYARDTVKEYRKRACAKLQAKNVTNAVAIAIVTGLLNPEYIVNSE